MLIGKSVVLPSHVRTNVVASLYIPWMTNTNSKKMANIYLPKMGGHHKAKCTESPLRSIHQLLDHSISVVPLVQHSRGSQQHHWIYHLRKWKRQLASSINFFSKHIINKLSPRDTENILAAQESNCVQFWMQVPLYQKHKNKTHKSSCTTLRTIQQPDHL